jgi:cytochrome c553
MKWMYVIMVVLLSVLIVVACNDSVTAPNSTSPDDHTINRGGVRHKSGYTDPVNNCTACHGDDLRGGSAAVSCFKCHGQKWT